MASSTPSSKEVQAAVSYLLSHLSTLSLSSETQATLANSLTSNLQAKYDSHWHTSDPERGSAYRALTRSCNTLDDVLVTSLKTAYIPVLEACKALNASMACDKWTLWIDPGCVSIRLQGAGGVQYNNTTLDAATSSPASTTSKLTISGITEIWGKLPSSVIAAAGVATVGQAQAQAPATITKSARKSKSIRSLSAAAAKLAMEEEASVAAEFEALALNASPAAKKSKAIAIMKPVVHRGVTSIASSDSVNVASTPPRPLPPLCFTIQESTSPYVPSFATTARVGDNTSTSSSSGGNTITRATTPSLLGSLASPPLYTSDSITSSCSSGSASSDPFARPSSRSSTTSLGSATSCSIFSHSSSDSRSSSIGSFTADEAVTDEEKEQAGNTTITALPAMKASKGEMDAAKSFIFPNSATALKADTLALLPVASAPNSPSKSNTRRRHDRSASIISIASSNASHHSGNSAKRPSSRTEVRVEKEIAKAQEYSNGKVGVLGGGVMLGPKKDSSNHSNSSNNNSHKRTHSTASSNIGMSTLNIAKTNSRPGKSRTTSSGSVNSNGSDYHHNAHYQQQHYNAYTHQQQQQQAGAYNWSHYPAPPAQIPHQYRY